MTSEERPAISRYSDYRQYLSDVVEHKQSLRPSFSYRRLSQLAGLKNPSFLRLVVQGKKNMSVQVAQDVARALGLSEAESHCFCAMVGLENAATDNERALAETLLERSRRDLVTHRMQTDEIRLVLAKWHHLVVRELALLPGFVPDGTAISRRLRGLITPREAEESICLLIRTGFLEQDPADGRYHAAEPVLDTGDDRDSLMAAHLETLRMWCRILPEIPAASRELGLLNIPISTPRIAELKRRMRMFQDEIIGWLQDETHPDALIQLGLYLVPLTELDRPAGTSANPPSFSR